MVRKTINVFIERIKRQKVQKRKEKKLISYTELFKPPDKFIINIINKISIFVTIL